MKTHVCNAIRESGSVIKFALGGRLFLHNHTLRSNGKTSASSRAYLISDEIKGLA